MTRRLALEWPDPAPFRDRDGAPIRILAVSDVLDPTLIDKRSRNAVMPVDLIVGCGDLECDDLAFVADSFDAPLVYVHGNHDSEAAWQRYKEICPAETPSTAVVKHVGVPMAGLTWPGRRGKGAIRSERAAWSQALRLAVRRVGRARPMIVLSHVPPLGVGDVPTDAYHRGFKGYRWLLERIEPTLWLHGHTPLAAAGEWKVTVGASTVVNVTGAVVIDLLAPTPETIAEYRNRRRGRARDGQAEQRERVDRL